VIVNEAGYISGQLFGGLFFWQTRYFVIDVKSRNVHTRAYLDIRVLVHFCFHPIIVHKVDCVIRYIHRYLEVSFGYHGNAEKM